MRTQTREQRWLTQLWGRLWGELAHHHEIDWDAAARSPEFKQLVRKRRSFVIPALAFVFIWYFGFIALAGYAPDFMGERLIEGFTVGYALALTQFLMTWSLLPMAQTVGGGAGSVGGDAFLAIIAAVAFATIALVAGLVIPASGAVAHDLWSNVVCKGRDSEHEEVHVARLAAFTIGAIAIAIAIVGGSDLNVSYMVGLAFAVAASANVPALLLALTWKRFNTTGAVTGVLLGTVSSVGLVLLGPDVRVSDPLIELTQPAIISVPLGCLGCILGSLLSRDESKAEREFEELHVRGETGLGAGVPTDGGGWHRRRHVARASGSRVRRHRHPRR